MRRNSTSERSRGTVGGTARAAKCFSRQRYSIGNRAGKEEQEQYEDGLEDKDKSDQASAFSPQIARDIQWNVPGLY